MKVLILHQHFKTPKNGGAIRSYYLARALVSRGIETVVITGRDRPEVREDNVEGIKVHYLPISYDNRFGFARRIFSFMRFVIAAARFAARHKDADICYAISTPLTTGLAAILIRAWYKIPYVFEVGDLWPDAPIEMGFVRSRSLQRVLYQMERRIYYGAQSIVALSPAIADAIRTKFQDRIIHVLPNMADTDFFKPVRKSPALEKAFGVEGRFVVSYVGAIGAANGLHYLLRCAEESQRAEMPIRFLVCGDGAMLESLKKSCRQLSLQNLDFLPFRNREGVKNVMDVTDACFISYEPIKILETGSPNKYFDGLAAGKLMIINFGGWVKDEINRHACGIYVDPLEPLDFIRRIKPFLDDPGLCDRYQNAARSLAEKDYSRTRLGDRFTELIMAQTSGRRT